MSTDDPETDGGRPLTATEQMRALERNEPSKENLKNAHFRARNAVAIRAWEQAHGFPFPPSKPAMLLIGLFFAWGFVAWLGLTALAPVTAPTTDAGSLIWLCVTVWGYYPVVGVALEIEALIR